MQIAEQLVLLAELQNVEQKLRAARGRADELPARAHAARGEADATRARVGELESAHRQQESERRRLESELAAEKDKLRKWQHRADQIRGEREHAALASEIGAQKRSIERLEETILERMQVLEDLEKSLTGARAAAATAEREAESEWAQVKDDLAVAQAEVERIERGRQALLERLPPPVFKRYARIAEARQGTGVALIVGETCQACRRTLPPQLCMQVYRGQVLETCPSCQRILVHESVTRSSGADEAAEAASGDEGDRSTAS